MIETTATVKKISEDVLDVDKYGNEQTEHTLPLKLDGMSHRDFLRLCRAKLLEHTIVVQIQCLQFELPEEPGPPGHIEDQWGNLVGDGRRRISEGQYLILCGYTSVYIPITH